MVIKADPVPCTLPPLPQPVVFGGVPSGENVLVTKDGLVELARWIAGTRAWIIAASGCLAVPR